MPDSQLHETSDNFTLTARQARAVGYLLTCRTVGEAAKKTGVTERTIFTWLNQDHFKAAIREAGLSTIDHTSRRLAQGQADALDSLSQLMKKAKSEWTRRAAAVDWLHLTLKYRDVNELEERLTQLERVVYDEKKSPSAS